MAHPYSEAGKLSILNRGAIPTLSNRCPIAADAASDWSRRRLLSSVSAGSANMGELRVLDTSVGGVDDRDNWELDETLAVESG